MSLRYRTKRTDAEIDQVLDQVDEQIDSGSKFPGMSYEEGLREMFDWLTKDESEIECDPMGVEG